MQVVKMVHFKYKIKEDLMLMYKKIYKKVKNTLLGKYVGMQKGLIFIKVNKKINNKNKIVNSKYHKRKIIKIYCLN